jgi:hypothetical protein
MALCGWCSSTAIYFALSPPRVPQGDPQGLQQQHSCRGGRSGGGGRAVLWCRQAWSICLFFLASLFPFMLILTVSCPADLNCPLPLVTGIFLKCPAASLQEISNSEHLRQFFILCGYCAIFIKLRYTAVSCSNKSSTKWPGFWSLQQLCWN